MCGETQNITSLNDNYGIVTKKVIKANKEGEIYYEISLIGRDSGRKYVVSQDIFNSLPNNAYIVYKQGAIFSKYDFNLVSYADITGNMEVWQNATLRRVLSAV